VALEKNLSLVSIFGGSVNQNSLPITVHRSTEGVIRVKYCTMMAEVVFPAFMLLMIVLTSEVSSERLTREFSHQNI